MVQRLFSKGIVFALLILIVSLKLYADTPASFPVGTQNFSLEDKSRHKKMSGIIWYPAVSEKKGLSPKGIWEQASQIPDAEVNVKSPLAHHGQLPLIILSHGYMGSPESLSWLAVSMAQQGFVVIGIQHNDRGPDASKPYMEHWNRALDDSFILREIKNLPIQKYVDLNRVGMIGYSVGTSTGLWLAGGVANHYERTINPGLQFAPEEEFPEPDSAVAEYLAKHTDFVAAKKNYREPLIKSVFLMAPGYGWAFDAKNLSHIKIPVFLVAAEQDEMLYPETNAYYFSKYIPNSALKIIPHVGHFVFLNQRKELTSPDLTAEEKKHIQSLPTLGKFQYTREERQAVHDEVSMLAINFFKITLENNH